MKQLDKLLVIILLCCGTVAFGQSKQVKKANELYKLNRFSEAIPLYENALKKKSSTSVKTKLANCYRFLNKTEKAEELYAEIVKKEHVNSKVYLYYGESLMGNAKYDEAKKWFQKYSELQPDDEMGHFYVRACEQVEYIEPYFIDVRVKAFTQNTEFDDTAPVFANNSLVFSSDRTQGGVKILKQKSSMTGRDFIRVYSSYQNPDGTFEPAKPMSNKINELNKNTGPITFTGDGKLAIFSCNAKEPNKKEMYPLQLYSAELEDNNKWKNVELLSINRSGNNYMHPALSPDGNKLFFVSDKGNGLGGTDLYYTERTDNGWSKPQNLGPFINTSSNEGFPFYSSDGKLYFSSKGHIGFGGYDIFYTQQDEQGRWKKPVNVGQPINSSQDDISIFVFPGEEKGFFTSSREGGDDDIFLFEKEQIQSAPEPDVAFLSLPEEETTEPIIEDSGMHTDPTVEELPVPQPIKTEVVEEVAEEPTYHINEPPVAKNTAVNNPEVITAPPIAEVQELADTEVPANETRQEMDELYTEQEEVFGDEIAPKENANIENAEHSTNPPSIYSYEKDEMATNPVVANDTAAEYLEEPKETTAAIEQKTSTFTDTEMQYEVEKPNEPVVPALDAAAQQTLPGTSTDTPQFVEVKSEDQQKPTSTQPRFEISESGEEVAPTPSFKETTVTPALTEVHEGEKIIVAPEVVEEVLTADEIATPRAATSFTIATYDDLRFALSEDRLSIGQTFQLPDIRFPFNEFNHNITSDIAQELDNLAEILRANPNLRIEIGGYSESYGEDRVNLTLSRYRAEAAMDYLIKAGIDSGRLVARGYGESKPLNHCVNGVLCSRAQHLENQRLEIKVLRQ